MSDNSKSLNDHKQINGRLSMYKNAPEYCFNYNKSTVFFKETLNKYYFNNTNIKDPSLYINDYTKYYGDK